VPRVLRTRAGRAVMRQVLGTGAGRRAHVIRKACQASAKCRGFVSQRLPEMGSFRQGVTDCRGFVSQRLSVRLGKARAHYRLPWLRFVGGDEMGSFRHAVISCRGFVSSARYRLPWLRFATAHGIGFVSSRRYRLPWLRFVDGPRHAANGDSLRGTGSENPWHPESGP
jgi:hypothetical protein